jgi:hypothetical protein
MPWPPSDLSEYPEAVVVEVMVKAIVQEIPCLAAPPRGGVVIESRPASTSACIRS